MKWGGSSWLVMRSASLLQISTLTSTAIHYSCARIFTSEDRNNIYFEIFFKSNRHGFIEKTLVRCPRFAFYLKAWVLPVVDHILSMRLILKKILRLRKLIVGFCKKQRLSNIFIDSCFLIKLLFHTGFSEAELRSYTSVVHANVYQTIKILYDGAKELAQNESDSSKYEVSPDNKEKGERLSELGCRWDHPFLTKEIAQDIKSLWQDSAIQETFSHGNMLQIPDCAQYFMENLERLSQPDYVPTKEDVLYARVRTSGVVEIQFSPVGESKKSGEVYKLYDVGGQRNERRKWIHLFEGVTAVIFCAAISEYDQTLFEDETKNRMMETKELFDWVLKQKCFEKTSFMLFLNKFDIFEKKVQKVPLSVCDWFKDYHPTASGKQEVEHAYEFVKKKFEELYFHSSKPDRVDRVFKIYRTTALDQKLVKKTFKLVDETLRRRNLMEAGLL